MFELGLASWEKTGSDDDDDTLDMLGFILYYILWL